MLAFLDAEKDAATEAGDGSRIRPPRVPPGARLLPDRRHRRHHDRAEGEPRGFTANSFTSVSLDPPLVLVCIAKKASRHRGLLDLERFRDQHPGREPEGRVPASSPPRPPTNSLRVAWQSGQTGNPLIDGSVAWFDCAMEQLVDAGDHVILIGRFAISTHNAAQPLGYCRGAYVTLGLSQEALAAAPPGRESAPSSNMKAACCSSRRRTVSSNCRRVAAWAGTAMPAASTGCLRRQGCRGPARLPVRGVRGRAGRSVALARLLSRHAHEPPSQ